MKKRDGRFFLFFMAAVILTVFSCNLPGMIAGSETQNLRKTMDALSTAGRRDGQRVIRDLCDPVVKSRLDLQELI
jgi:hypothetical protein